MLKREITFTNPFTEEEETEEHYFHISKADLVEMEMEEHKDEYTDKSGKDWIGMQAKIKRIIDAEDGKEIMGVLKDIIRRAYGKRDGSRFIKTDEIWEEFASSEAFSQFFFELLTDTDKMSEFVNNIVPKDLEKMVAEIQTETADPTGLTTPTPEPATTAGPTPVPAVPEHAVADLTPERRQEIAAATSENPVHISQAELAHIRSENLRAGLADGRYQLS